MTQQQLESLLSVTKRLRQQKYPILVIAIVVVLTLLSNVMPKTTMDECTVLKIYDGDTMTLQCQNQETKVRLYCIDAPEMGQAPWGKQARDHLRSITAEVVKVIQVDKDRYGRVVGEIYRNNENLNLTQVKTGYAAVYDAYCKKAEYQVAENQASKAKLGIWSMPGIQQTPWEWRKQKK